MAKFRIGRCKIKEEKNYTKYEIQKNNENR